jgi:ATP/maltotriose-dependent transcriptional regulator MalT
MNPAISSNALYDGNLTQIVECRSYNNNKFEKFQFIASLTSKGSKNTQNYFLTSNNNSAEDSVVGHLQINGQLYAIVKAEDTSTKSNPNLAKILSEREFQIATLVTLGYSNKQIADRLQASEWNICTHLRRVFIKLGVTNRTAMISRCASLTEEAIASSF